MTCPARWRRAWLRTHRDVGCGTGISSRQLRAADGWVLGVDPEPQMAVFARQRGLEAGLAARGTSRSAAIPSSASAPHGSPAAAKRRPPGEWSAPVRCTAHRRGPGNTSKWYAANGAWGTPLQVVRSRTRTAGRAWVLPGAVYGRLACVMTISALWGTSVLFRSLLLTLCCIGRARCGWWPWCGIVSVPAVSCCRCTLGAVGHCQFSLGPSVRPLTSLRGRRLPGTRDRRQGIALRAPFRERAAASRLPSSALGRGMPVPADM